MFINAKPRAVSTSFQSFVPLCKVNSSYQLLDLMMESGYNAWDTLGPVASSMLIPKKWTHGFENIGNEGYSPGFSSGQFNPIASCIQHRDGNYLSVATLRGPDPRQELMSVRQIAMHSPHELQNFLPMGSETPVPLFEDPTYEWVMGNTPPNILTHPETYIIDSNDGSGNGYQNLDGADLVPMMLPSTRISKFSVCDSLSRSGTFESIQNSHCKTYGSSPGLGGLLTESTPTPRTQSTLQNDLSNDRRWERTGRDFGSLNSIEITSPFSCDGIPGNSSLIWSAPLAPMPTYTQLAPPCGTISPCALTLSSRESSSESSLSSIIESPSLSVSMDDTAMDSHPGSTTCQEIDNSSSHSTTQRRQKLPSEPVAGLNRQAIGSPAIPEEKHLLMTNIRSYSTTNQENQICSLPEIDVQGTSRVQQPLWTRKLQLKLVRRPKPEKVRASSCIANLSPDFPTTADVGSSRVAKDDFLVKSKMAGMTYKEIRRHGGFTEAESTLRGRYRTLTKKKHERVRKPEWEDNDIRLLRGAVRKLTKDSDSSSTKVPWKLVADYIFENGGSYRFGNATCRKRWDELNTPPSL